MDYEDVKESFVVNGRAMNMFFAFRVVSPLIRAARMSYRALAALTFPLDITISPIQTNGLVIKYRHRWSTL